MCCIPTLLRGTKQSGIYQLLIVRYKMAYPFDNQQDILAEI